MLWTYDLFAMAWSTPLVADGKVFVTDEDGEVAIFDVSREKRLIGELIVPNSAYPSPAASGQRLFIADKQTLYAIETGAQVWSYRPTQRQDQASTTES